MIKSYLRSAFRNFIKQKGFTLLNVVGLSLGIAACLLILQYVKYEKSFDTFHHRAQDTYRIQYNGWRGGKLNFECAAAVPAVGPALKNNFPEVERFTRLFPVSGVITYESPENGVIAFKEDKMQITDPAVFEVFDFKLLNGNVATALEGPNKVVITKSAAKKYFGAVDPMGKTISWDGRDRFEVTGIMEDVPTNSHITFNFLFSYQTLNNQTDNESETAWGWYDFNTYVTLKSGTDVVSFQSKWDKWLLENRGEEWNKHNYKQEFLLQPLLDIHLYSNLLQESIPEQQGDGNSVYFLTIIAFFILFIAWVNYVNLATAKSFERANEVGVRKVMGAEKSQLLYQFLSESFLINTIAAFLAVLIVWIAWPTFSSLSGRNIPINYLLQKDFWFLVVVLFGLGAILSGFYPAIVLSSFRPVTVLKGKIAHSVKGGLLRKSLVVVQFAASVVLITGSIVVYQQLNFMKQQDLGFDMNQTLVLQGPGIVDSLYNKNFESFKNEVVKIAGVKTMTSSSNVPGDEIFWTRGIQRITGGPETNITVYNVGIDYDYITSYDLSLLAGRNFQLDNPGDKRNAILLNHSLSDALDFSSPEEAIGQKVRLGGDTLEVIGVLENYHQMSLKSEVAPLVFRCLNTSAFYSFKIEASDFQNLLNQLREPWDTFFPGNPLNYFFLDQFFNKQYESDRQFGQVFGIFTILAIFVACLGLFGLASFMTVQRTKEIGIRKVLGSTVPNIVLLLSKGFIKLVLIANLIAWPLAWFVMDTWLQSFPYRIQINPFLFVGAGIVVVIIAFLSVGFQTLKAAMINPAKTLKYE